MSARIIRAFAALLLIVSSGGQAGAADPIGRAAYALANHRRTVECFVFEGQSVTHGAVPFTVATASISGATMTVTSVTNPINSAVGYIEAADANPAGVGATVTGGNVAGGPVVLHQLTGTPGSTGTYTVSVSQTAASGQVEINVAQAFGSLRKPSLTAPLYGALSNVGGGLFRFYDDMWDYGYDVRIVNAAKGSMSLIQQGAGQIKSWTASTNYSAKRASAGWPDRGDTGDLINPYSTYMFRATTGRTLQAMNNYPFASAAGSTALDSVAGGGTGTSGSTAPAWSSLTTVGQTIADGTVVWTLENKFSDSYAGGGNAVFGEAQKGFGFDRLGIIANSLELLATVSPGCDDTWYYIDGNQADVATGTTAYNWRVTAVTNVAQAILARNIKTIIAPSMIYSPGSGSTAAHQNENAANVAATAALKAGAYGNLVYTGADLYAALGTNLQAQGCLQADLIHLNGACSLLQGDAYAAAFKTILGKPGWRPVQ